MASCGRLLSMIGHRGAAGLEARVLRLRASAALQLQQLDVAEADLSTALAALPGDVGLLLLQAEVGYLWNSPKVRKYITMFSWAQGLRLVADGSAAHLGSKSPSWQGGSTSFQDVAECIWSIPISSGTSAHVLQVLREAGRHQEELLALQGVLAAAPGTPGLLQRLQAAAVLAAQCQRRGATSHAQVFISAEALSWLVAVSRTAAVRRHALVISLRICTAATLSAGCWHGTEQWRLRRPLHRARRRPRRCAQRIQAAGGTVAPRQVGGSSSGRAGGCSGTVSGGAACI
jgi:hypothetical protein